MGDKAGGRAKDGSVSGEGGIVSVLPLIAPLQCRFRTRQPMKNVTVLPALRVCCRLQRPARAAQDCEKPLHPATLSRLPISSCNYTSNCFSFTGPGSINGPRRRAGRQLSSFKAGDSGMRWAVKSQVKPPALQAHPRRQSFKMCPRNHFLLTSA